jgi:hypothetical protein
MNNLTWSGNSPAKKSEIIKDETKTKKKVDYKKELLDLERVLEKIEEKYDMRPTNPVSSSIVNLKSSIEALKKEIENMKYMDGKRSDN